MFASYMRKNKIFPFLRAVKGAERNRLLVLHEQARPHNQCTLPSLSNPVTPDEPACLLESRAPAAGSASYRPKH